MIALARSCMCGAQQTGTITDIDMSDRGSSCGDSSDHKEKSI